MSQWSSSYLEQALGIPKVWGDVCGVAVFAAALGLGRTLYSKYGKNIHAVLAVSAVGATVCYLTAAVSSIPLVGLAACALTGLCTAAGVAMYAAGGDLGGAIGPQLVGSIADWALTGERIRSLSSVLSLTTEQLSMKIGLTSVIIFPLCATVLYVKNWRDESRKNTQ